jgi:F-box-like
MGPSSANFMPTDIFYVILEHLVDRRDLHAAALTNRDFNRAATPLLYRTLDTDTRPRLWGHKSVRLLQLLLNLKIALNYWFRTAI